MLNDRYNEHAAVKTEPNPSLLPHGGPIPVGINALFRVKLLVFAKTDSDDRAMVWMDNTDQS